MLTAFKLWTKNKLQFHFLKTKKLKTTSVSKNQTEKIHEIDRSYLWLHHFDKILNIEVNKSTGNEILKSAET